MVRSSDREGADVAKVVRTEIATGIEGVTATMTGDAAPGPETMNAARAVVEVAAAMMKAGETPETIAGGMTALATGTRAPGTGMTVREIGDGTMTGGRVAAVTETMATGATVTDQMIVETGARIGPAKVIGRDVHRATVTVTKGEAGRVKRTAAHVARKAAKAAREAETAARIVRNAGRIAGALGTGTSVRAMAAGTGTVIGKMTGGLPTVTGDGMTVAVAATTTNGTK